jgi:EpsI family protein
MRVRILIVLGCLVATAGLVARADRHEQPPARASFAVFPMQIGEWRGTQLPPFTESVLKILGLEDYLTRNYTGVSGPSVNVYVGYWSSQRQGDTMHSPQNCLPGSGWEPQSQGLLKLRDPRPGAAGDIELNRYVIQKGLDRQFVLYWYQSHGRIIGSEYWSKIYLVADAVRLNRTDAALVRIIVPVVGDAAKAEALAEQQAVKFVNDFLPKLTAFVPN